MNQINPSQSKKPNVVGCLYGCLATIGGAVVLAIIIVLVSNKKPPATSYGRNSNVTRNTPKPAQSNFIPVISKPKYSKSMYDRIQRGMTYEQVVSIMGGPGEEQSSFEASGLIQMNTKNYIWDNKRFSHVMVVFNNNRVEMKSHVGLK